MLRKSNIRKYEHTLSVIIRQDDVNTTAVCRAALLLCTSDTSRSNVTRQSMRGTQIEYSSQVNHIGRPCFSLFALLNLFNVFIFLAISLTYSMKQSLS